MVLIQSSCLCGEPESPKLFVEVEISAEHIQHFHDVLTDLPATVKSVQFDGEMFTDSIKVVKENALPDGVIRLVVGGEPWEVESSHVPCDHPTVDVNSNGVMFIFRDGIGRRYTSWRADWGSLFYDKEQTV